ncbi:MAG: tape measure protein [Verrucomicrobiales bacterium]
MSNGTLSYKLGGDASGLQAAFATPLRFAGTFSENLKKTLSIRGLFEGFGGAIQNALGGSTIGEVFGGAVRGALGKEVNEMRFGAMLGDGAAKAAPLLSNIASLAREAAVETGGLNDQAARLAGYEMNAARIADTLRMLTDITKITGGSTEELGAIYGQAFRDGVVEFKKLHQLTESNVNVLAELEKITQRDKNGLMQMGQEGKITFDMLEQAFRNLTTGEGKYADGVARIGATSMGMAQQIRAEFGRIPTAFFSGIIGDGLGATKGVMGDILGIVRGWVASAQSFGRWIAAAVRTARELYSQGELWDTFKLGLEAAFVGAINLLIRGLAHAANGFGEAISQAMTEVKDAMTPFKPQKPGAGGRIGEAFKAGFAEKVDEKNTFQFKNEAAEKFQKAFAPGMAAQLLPAQIAAGLSVAAGGPLAALGFAGGVAQLGLMNDPGKGGARGADAVKPQTDRLSSIGLYVGAGGPQAEAHAKATAKHTKNTADGVKQLVENTAGLPGLAPGKFGGRNR